MRNTNLREIKPSCSDTFEDALQSALSEASGIGKSIRSIHIVKEIEYLIENNQITSHGVNTKIFLEMEAGTGFQPIHYKDDVQTAIFTA